MKHPGAVVPWPYPPDGALTFNRDVAIPQMERGAAWRWTMRLKPDPDRMIWAISLRAAESKPGVTNRGFLVAPEFQGRGPATEATEAANGFWFETLADTCGA